MRTRGNEIAAARFVIQRPRLLARIEESDARIVLLRAPAGYGKSTLAKQWVEHVGAAVAWYQASAASQDVTALALGLAQSMAPLADGSPALRQHLDALSQPAEHPEDLAETLADALSGLAPSTWLVIDEHDHIASSAPAVRFVEVLLERVAIRALVVGRRRPTWATARRLLYGEVEEIGEAQLSFTEKETEEVLAAVNATSAHGLWLRTKGWPAVIRLAALSGSTELPELELSSALHDYFAEELFNTASPQLQEALGRLALLPTLDRQAIELALGDDVVAVCDEGVELGFLSLDASGQLDLHPLLRAFLDRRTIDRDDRDLALSLVYGVIRARLWDDAFLMVQGLDEPQLIPDLIEAALDPLLEEGRLATLQTWVRYAHEKRLVHPLVLLADAEISRRSAKFRIAESQALQAAHSFQASGDAWTSRAFSVAGVCA
jgi:LuxR family maltose regulon positive regulatory protein